MKNKLLFSCLIILFFSELLLAQNKLSVGLVTSRFDNIGSDHKLTEVKTPFGYGVILGYSLNKEITIALTEEYFKDDLENKFGEETDYRSHISVYFSPFKTNLIKPYFSAGLVYTYRKINYSNSGIEESKNIFNGRFGIGLDYNLLQNIYLNVDAGLYNDGLTIVGWSSSIGIRVNPNIF